MPRGWGTKYQYKAPPRKAMSAYSFYVQDWYRYWRRMIRTRNPHRVIREVARQWKRAEADQKNKYLELAIRDKQRAKTERAAYYKLLDAGELQPPPLRVRITKVTGYPRSTRNAYVFFSNEIRGKIRVENPNMPYVEVMREISQRWRKLDDKEKKQYRNRKEADKARYKAAKVDYRAAQKEAKRKKRLEEGRARLNRLFNQRVPKAMQVPPKFEGAPVDAAPRDAAPPGDGPAGAGQA